jgi:hypothetical protein
MSATGWILVLLLLLIALGLSGPYSPSFMRVRFALGPYSRKNVLFPDGYAMTPKPRISASWWRTPLGVSAVGKEDYVGMLPLRFSGRSSILLKCDLR